MSDAGKDNNQERNRVIAQNEAERQTTGDIRVSGWAIVFAVIAGCIAVGVAWAWLGR
jgi:Flp pilus assembly protein TadB